MEDKPLYNSRIISTFVEYLSKTRPDINIEALLADSGIAPYEVADEGHWLTQRQVDAFHDSLAKTINDPSIFREAGRYTVSSRSITAIRQFLVGFLTPIQAYAMLEKIASYIILGITFKTTKIGPNKVEVIVTPLAGVQEKPYQCENRKGYLESVVQLFINKMPLLEHPDCIHQGDGHCRYIISWDEPVYLKLRRIRNYSAVSAVLLIAICWFNLSPLPLSILVLILAAIVVGISHYADYVEKKDIYAKMEIQGNVANRLLDEIKIGYNNVLMVQEISQAVSSILDIDRLLQFVMDTLQKRLDFDRGMIMLANPEKTRLLYVCGFGYNPTHEELLKKTSFRLDSPESRGQFVTAFKEQCPLLIDNAKDLKENLSSHSYEFIETFDVRSFICVPIVYEGQSEGIMAVDNRRSNKPLGQSEVTLLMGIAPQIGIGLNNARALQQVRVSEERFRALSENSPDIIYTLDINGCLTYVNPAGENILGYKRGDVLGQPFLSFVKKEDEPTYTQLLNRVKAGKETIKNFKGILRTSDDREKLFDMSGAPNFDARGNFVGIVGMLKDFTEQNNLEKQLLQTSKMNAIGTLTGGISHDFNNIVQAISGYNQLLMMKKEEADPDWKYLIGIDNLTQRATELINQLLLFSRKVESTMMPLDINDEID
ncbi:MAG: PAS domain S-box protein, partial [Syntrophales bacterium LBB04]|nr:PAS domain S-box protein [Syntrophales bacterium LBB04]